MPEIKSNEVYTPKEIETLLKVSKSTIKRLLKRGLLRANKVGKQYRIMGHEILRLISPKLEEDIVETYQKISSKTKEKVKDW